MWYDIAAKVIVEKGKEALLRHFLRIEAVSAELIEEAPQETVSLRSSDFPLRIQMRDGDERIVLLEFQTHWTVDAVWRMIDYVYRFKLKYRLPVIPAMLLFREHPTATGTYRDECVEFRYHLVKLWEQPAREVLEHRLYPLLPFTPLMAATDDDVLAAERRIYESDLPRSEKADLLTALGLFAGMRDASLARRLFERRRDIMIESPIYELIKQEGRQEGRQEGKQEGRQEGKQEGLQDAVISLLAARFGARSAEITLKVREIKDTGELNRILHAIGEGKSFDEVRWMIEEAAS